MSKSKKRKSQPNKNKENKQENKEITSKKADTTTKPNAKKKKDPLVHIHNPLNVSVDITDPIGDMPILGITTNIDKKCICLYYENGTFIFCNKVFKVMSTLRSSYKTVCALLLNSHLIICTRKRKVISYSFLNLSYSCIGDTEDQIVGIFTVKVGYDGFIVVDKKGTIYFFQPINHHWKLDTVKHLNHDISYIVVENNILYWWSLKKGVYMYNIITDELVHILQETRVVSYIKPVILEGEEHLIVSMASGITSLVSLVKKEYRLVAEISPYRIRSACLCNINAKGLFFVQITTKRKKLSRKERKQLQFLAQTTAAEGQPEQPGQPGQSTQSGQSQPGQSQPGQSTQSGQSTPTPGQPTQSGQSTQPGQLVQSSQSQPTQSGQSGQSSQPTQPISDQLKEGSKQDKDEICTQISFSTFPSLDLVRCILNDCDSAQTIVDFSSITNSCCLGVICETKQLIIIRLR